jgi:hypothetical protein
MHRSPGLYSTAVLLLLIGGAEPAHALSIIDTFGGSVTGNANGAQIEATIQSASNAIATLYSNPVTVTINFQLTNQGLGGSSQYLYAASYASYTQALKNDLAANPSNTTLASAVANLSKGNDATGRTPMAVTSTLVDTLGLGNISAGGTVYLNSSLIYFGTGTTPGNLYNGTAVIQHEIDEILGAGGAGSMLGTSLQNYYTGALDPYRYSSTGAPSYTSSSALASYFSVDGGHTLLARFNQMGVGDYGDLYGTTLIQNYAGTPGHTPEAFAGSLESTMLQAIGYDLAPAATSSLSTSKLLRGSGSRINPAPQPTLGAGLASLAFLAAAVVVARLRDRRRSAIAD